MSNQKLRLAAQLCSSSYYGDLHPAWAVDTVTAIAGIDDAYLVEGVSEVWVVFRGTEWSLKEWARNFQVKKVSVDGLGRIHGGFFTNLTELWNQLLSHDAFANKKINFCGHSRGGAIAQLAALTHKHVFDSAPSVYTFGSPRVGDRSFVAAYGDINTTRVTHVFDLVPKVPRWNFWHTPKQITKFKLGHAMWRYQKTAYKL